jgi:hypothetical protein
VVEFRADWAVFLVHHDRADAEDWLSLLHRLR